MEKYIYDEKNGLWYELQGDYYLPCLKLPEEEQRPIGVWGQRHLRYIKQYRKIFYANLMTTGQLSSHLADIDRQAQEVFNELVRKYAKTLGVTEQLKAENQMKWVSLMDNIRACATETVNRDIIYA